MTDSPDPAALARLLAGCPRHLAGHGRRAPDEILRELADHLATDAADRYGEGGAVAELEGEVASLLGKPAALFLPTGTMAQQAVLRVHADRRGRRSVVWHPECHLDTREGRAYQRLHSLVGVPTGAPRLPLTLGDLEQVAEAPAALLVELPQRDLGGVLPEWDELVAQTQWARDRGAATHMDGARLWESAPYYERPPAEIAALFDTVYVSFYKGLGALGGCCVAGEADVIAELSEWRTRHGGRAFALWPYAASALVGLRTRAQRMGEYWAHARSIAGAVAAIPDVAVLPTIPQTNMMHLRLAATPDELAARAAAIAESDGIATFSGPFAVDDPGHLRVELSVGDATLGFTPEEVAALVGRLAGVSPE